MTPAVEEAVLASPACAAHAANAPVASCVRCDRPVCHVCVFTFGGDTWCPECLTSGDSAEESSGLFGKGVLSVLLAVLGGGLTAVFFVAGDQLGDTGAIVLFYPWIASTIGGAALALIARDGARRRGSVLPTIGLVANGILIAIQLALTVYGNFVAK